MILLLVWKKILGDSLSLGGKLLKRVFQRVFELVADSEAQRRERTERVFLRA